MTPDLHTFPDAAAAAEACAGTYLHLLHSALVGSGHASLADLRRIDAETDVRRQWRKPGSIGRTCICSGWMNEPFRRMTNRAITAWRRNI